jgi:hypothetical protein
MISSEPEEYAASRIPYAFQSPCGCFHVFICIAQGIGKVCAKKSSAAWRHRFLM